MASGKRNLARHFRSNMTLPEVILWKRIQKDQLGVRFRRQYQIEPFIIDFYCNDPKLAVEVDGQVHTLRQESDAERDVFLSAKGIHVLRIAAQTVLQYPDSAVAMIEDTIALLNRNEDILTSSDHPANE